MRDFHLVFLSLVVDRDESTVLPLFLHLLEDLDEKLEFFLQFLGGAADERGKLLIGLLLGEEALACVHTGCTALRLFLGEDIDLPQVDLIMYPLGNGLRVDLLLFLVENSHNFLLSICQILILLVGGVEVELAHLVRFEGDAQEVDDLDQLVHAQLVLRNLPLVQGHQEEVQ